ncbi:LysE family translocator [Rhizobium sp. L1K21]|uniref:LysE family translocator n=1 Tax=Rhizobium sp. L1K21 TaxID=2954933 RepID=UPI0020931CD3|nr:LysE family translocator [Rhizobium sp. L1K21]MCO6184717.1 LysE family translocator [Rhizobium sp. L1K21]
MDFLPNLATLTAFTLASLLLTLTPGPDMTLQMSRSMRDGRSVAFWVLLGTNFGICVHTLLVAFGVSALIIASPVAFMILKTGGAAYLFWLAIQAIFKGSTFRLGPQAKKPTKVGALSAMFNGLWVNILNPKVIIFFMTFLPQFVSAGDPHVTGKLIFLGFYFIVVALPFGIAFIVAADKLSNWLMANKRVLRTIDYTFGGVFSLFAVKILFTQAR